MLGVTALGNCCERCSTAMILPRSHLETLAMQFMSCH